LLVGWVLSSVPRLEQRRGWKIGRGSSRVSKVGTRAEITPTTATTTTATVAGTATATMTVTGADALEAVGVRRAGCGQVAGRLLAAGVVGNGCSRKSELPLGAIWKETGG